MKKVINLVLMIMVIVLCSSFVTFAAEETYDSKWMFSVKSQDGKTTDFEAGDIIEVQVVNNTSSSYEITDAVAYFTYNSEVLEYATEDDIDAIYKAYNELSIAVCKLTSTGGDVSAFETEIPGIFKGVYATGTSAKAMDDMAIFKVYFKVKEGASGQLPLHFRWIHAGKHASFAASELGNYMINYIDAYCEVAGEQIKENEPDSLPTVGTTGKSYIFVPEVNPTSKNPVSVSLNGKSLNLTTPYFVAFSKLVTRNSGVEEVGMLVSKNSISDMTEETYGVKKVVASNISSANHFGVLFYGNAFYAGNTYYTRAYTKYKDGTVIYGTVVPVTLAD